MKSGGKWAKVIGLSVLAAVIVVALMVNTTISYIVRKKTAHNVFSVGVAELTVEEESFPEEEEDRWMVPKSVLPKNPRLKNTGTTSVYAFAEVTVPYDKVQLVMDEGEYMNRPDPQGQKEQELFHLLSDDENAVAGHDTVGFTNGFTVTAVGTFTYGHNWVFLQSFEDTANKTHTYLFGYSSLLTTDPEHNTTDTIFDKIQLRNILEGELSENPVKTISVQAYAVQAEELQANITVLDPEHLSRSELMDIYGLYQTQEG